MMKLLMANSLSCSMQQWNGQDTLSTTLYIWTQAELVRGNARRKYREYTDCLDVLTQHQVTLSLLLYMCLVRCTLYHSLTQLRNVQVHWCLWDAPELQYYQSPIIRDESDEYLWQNRPKQHTYGGARLPPDTKHPESKLQRAVSVGHTPRENPKDPHFFPKDPIMRTSYNTSTFHTLEFS